MDASSRSPLVEQTRGEHARLRDHAERLGAAVSSLPGEAERLQWMGDLCLDLAAFVTLLLEHFDSEEKDGSFGEIAQQRPELLPEIRRLEEQHREMTARVTALRAIVDDARVKRIATALEELLEQFDSHEAAENQLMFGAYEDDIGGG